MLLPQATQPTSFAAHNRKEACVTRERGPGAATNGNSPIPVCYFAKKESICADFFWQEQICCLRTRVGGPEGTAGDGGTIAEGEEALEANPITAQGIVQGDADQEGHAHVPHGEAGHHDHDVKGRFLVPDVANGDG